MPWQSCPAASAVEATNHTVDNTMMRKMTNTQMLSSSEKCITDACCLHWLETLWVDVQAGKKAKQGLPSSSHALKKCEFGLAFKVKGAVRRSALWRLRGAPTPSTPAHSGVGPKLNQVSPFPSYVRAGWVNLLHLSCKLVDCTDAFQASSHYARGLWVAVVTKYHCVQSGPVLGSAWLHRLQTRCRQAHAAGVMVINRHSHQLAAMTFWSCSCDFQNNHSTPNNIVIVWGKRLLP